MRSSFTLKEKKKKIFFANRKGMNKEIMSQPPLVNPFSIHYRKRQHLGNILYLLKRLGLHHLQGIFIE